MLKQFKSKITVYVLLTLVCVLALYVASAAVPLGPDTLTTGISTTMDNTNFPTKSTTAYAGNITLLTLYSRTQTKHWQGYYGEITGTIVLDDAQNWTLYDWPNAEPKGEIYATPNETTPSWSTAVCFNATDGYTGNASILTRYEAFYNMTYNDVDGLNETYNMTSHLAFDIGDVVTIANGSCPSTYTHVEDGWQTDRYSQILLQDAEERLIFTTIIENDDDGNNTDPIGYNNVSHDFQLLVAEDGTSRNGASINTDTTTYYFYVDLE